MRRGICFTGACLLAVAGFVPVFAAAEQQLTDAGAPYDLAEANWRALNYLQALISPKWQAVAFAHDTFGDAAGAGGLYFIDDQGRVLWAFACEAEHGPVARVDAAALLARGIMRARIPGSAGRYFFMIEGRPSLYFKPEGDRLNFYWLQDYSAAVCGIKTKTRARGGEWAETPQWDPETPVDNASGAVCGGMVGAARLKGTGPATVTDRAPALEVAAPEPVEVQAEIILSEPHTHVITEEGRSAAGEWTGSRGGWLMLEQDARALPTDKKESDWDHPSRWHRLNKRLLIAFDAPPERVELIRDGETFSRVLLKFGESRRVNLRFGFFQDIDPADAAFTLDAARRVAAEGVFGCGPYAHTRTSNSFMSAAAGLAAAAWLLSEHGHPDAGAVRDAAVEALQAVADSWKRGYHGERVYNAVIACRYLRRVAPDAFDYAEWARVWARHELDRLPPGQAAPPWTDTGLRMMCGLRYAAEITGDAGFARAADRALAEYELDAARPIASFLWRGTPRMFNSLECTASAMLLGEWGRTGDGRAETMAREPGPRYFCDFGFAPYQTWTCDDLLPYYAGYSLPLVYPNGPPRPVKTLRLDEYAAYDYTGAVTSAPRPDIPPAP